MTGTHDLPTIAGWWQGRDIDWMRRLGRSSSASEAEDRAQRVKQRSRLWSAIDADSNEPQPTQSDVVVDGAIALVGSTPCRLAILPLEDIAGLIEQPNMPGTTDQHPNWRRRMPEPTEILLSRPKITARLDQLNAMRKT